METLVGFLTSRIGYTLTAILGFGIPGNMFIFVFNRDLYMDMDIFKLILLSFGIPFMLFVPNIIVFAIGLEVFKCLFRKIFKEDMDKNLVFFMPVVITVIEMMEAMLTKIFNNEYCVKSFINDLIPWFIKVSAIFCIIEIIKWILETLKKGNA